MGIEPTNVGATNRCVNHFATPTRNGDPTGTRTPVTSVKGRCLNHLTMGPKLVSHDGLEPSTP